MKELTVLEQLRLISRACCCPLWVLYRSTLFTEAGVLLTRQPCQRPAGLFAEGSGKARHSPLKPLLKSGGCHFCSHFTGQRIYHQRQVDGNVIPISGRHQSHTAKPGVSGRGRNLGKGYSVPYLPVEAFSLLIICPPDRCQLYYLNTDML